MIAIAWTKVRKHVARVAKYKSAVSLPLVNPGAMVIAQTTESVQTAPRVKSLSRV